MTKANDAGKAAEQVLHCIINLLCEKGYSPKQQYILQESQLRAPYVFAEKIILDAFVRGIPDHETGLAISSKWQDSEGSAIEKIMAHVDHRIKKCLPYPAIILAVGSEYKKPKVQSYLKESIDGIWLVDVWFDFESALRWANGMPEKTGISNKEYEDMQGSLFSLMKGT